MLNNRPSQNQLTLFGHNVNKKDLQNLLCGLGILLFGVGLCIDHNRLGHDENSHQLGDNFQNNSWMEIISALMIWVFIIFLIKINWSSIKASIRECCPPLPPAQQPRNLPLHIAADAKRPADSEEKSSSIFISDTLERCVIRGKTSIANKLKSIDQSTLTIDAKYCCSISHLIAVCPVYATDGHLYDYDSLMTLFQGTPRGKLPVSPITRENISFFMTPQPALQDEIETFVDKLLKEAKHDAAPAGPGNKS